MLSKGGFVIRRRWGSGVKTWSWEWSQLAKRSDSWWNATVDDRAAARARQRSKRIASPREKYVRDNPQIRRNSREFSCRAAIWPLTLGPLGYGGSRNVSRIKGICPRPNSVSRPSHGLPVNGLVHAKRVSGLPVHRRRDGSPGINFHVCRPPPTSLLIRRSARTYVPSCRLIFRLKSHIQRRSADSSRSYGLLERDC